MEVIARHTTSALYNATEMKKIPLGWMWKPILKLQEGLGGRTKLITYSIATAVVVVLVALCVIPWELKMDSKGMVLPRGRKTIYPSRAGIVDEVVVGRGQKFGPNQVLIRMYDSELAKDMADLKSKIESNDSILQSLEKQLADPKTPESSKDELVRQRIKSRGERDMAEQERRRLAKAFNAMLDEPGRFNLMSPEFDSTRIHDKVPEWLILEGKDFKSELRGRPLKPSDSLFRVGEVSGEWEIEIRIPQKHMGQIQNAFKSNDPNEELDVELKLESHVTQTFRGKLARSKISPEIVPNKDDHNETEPVAYAYVRITGKDIPQEDQIPRNLYTTGVEVRANIRCGKHSMGYSLFYGVGEFICQKVFQFF